MRPVAWFLATLLISVGACTYAPQTGAGDPGLATTAPSVETTSSQATSTTSAAGPEWMLPGLRFLEGLGEALQQPDLDSLLSYYHPDAQLVVGTVGSTASGWRQIGNVIADLPAAAVVRPASTVLLSDWGALVLSGGQSGCGQDVCPEAWADIFEISEGAIAVQMHATPVIATSDDQLVDLYVGSAEAYTAHDVDALLGYYSRAAFAPPLPREGLESLFAEFPDVTAHPVTLADLGLADSQSPALFDLGMLGDSTRSRSAIALYRVRLTPEIVVTSAMLWDLWDGEILREATLFDPEGLADLVELAGGESIPEVWYSTIVVPSARSLERSHVVEVEGSAVELYNGTDTVAELLQWSMGRFEDAGLPPPQVAAIYVQTATSCLEGSAWSHTGGESAHIRLCLEEDELAEDGDLSTLGKVTMLHELGHVWAAENMSDEDRQDFVSERGLSAWNDQTVAWELRGSEHAAEILAWGLAEQAYELVRLGESDCPQLVAAFRSLTGVDPLHDC